MQTLIIQLVAQTIENFSKTNNLKSRLYSSFYDQLDGAIKCSFISVQQLRKLTLTQKRSLQKQKQKQKRKLAISQKPDRICKKTKQKENKTKNLTKSIQLKEIMNYMLFTNSFQFHSFLIFLQLKWENVSIYFYC